MAELRGDGNRTGLGVPLLAWMGFVTLATLWGAFRVGAGIRDSMAHGTFFRPLGGPHEIYWGYPTTIPFVVLAGTSAVALVGLLLLWLRRIAGLWVFVAAQLAAAVLLGVFGRLAPTALIGLVGAGLLVALVLQRRGAFQ